MLRDIVYIHDAHPRQPSLRSERSGQHHQRRLSHPAQRADPRLQGPARSGRVLGRSFDRLGRVRLHQARRLRARPARAERLHGLRPGRDEGPDEGRDDRPREAAHPRRPLHRHDRARHHRRRAAESDRQSARDHAGHREASRSVRAHARMPSSCFRAAPARPKKSCICSASCSIRRMPSSRCRSSSPARRPRPTTSVRSIASSVRRSAQRRRSATRSSSAIRRRPRAKWRAASKHVREYRRAKSDAYNFNWLLKIPPDFQRPFEPTHEAMAKLELRRDLRAARARGEPAPRVLRHRRRQREGAGRAGDRGARSVRAARRQGGHDAAGRAAVRRSSRRSA